MGYWAGGYWAGGYWGGGYWGGFVSPTAEAGVTLYDGVRDSAIVNRGIVDSLVLNDTISITSFVKDRSPHTPPAPAPAPVPGPIPTLPTSYSVNIKINKKIEKSTELQ